MLSSVFILLCCIFSSPVADAQEIKRFKAIKLNADNEHFPPLMLQQDNLPRSSNYPTQVIRLTLDLSSKNLNCDEVMDKIHSLTDQLDGKEISGGGFSSCGLSAEGKETFVHSEYMDPYTDEGIKNLQHFIEELNGTDFYGVPLTIEPAKGVIVSLRVDAGIIDSDEIPSISNSLYHMKNQLYFDSLYDMENTLFNDFLNQLSTNNPVLISSFIKRWLQRYARNNSISTYLESLANSNGVKISLKYTFIMDKEPKAYVLGLKTSSLHDCRIYPSGKCLG